MKSVVNSSNYDSFEIINIFRNLIQKSNARKLKKLHWQLKV